MSHIDDVPLLLESSWTVSFQTWHIPLSLLRIDLDGSQVFPDPPELPCSTKPEHAFVTGMRLRGRRWQCRKRYWAERPVPFVGVVEVEVVE